MTLPADAKQITTVILDIDGVLTDGRVGYGAGSDEEIKFFFVRDGLGLSLLRQVGLKVGALSGRKSGANARRARELSFDFLYEDCQSKLEGFQRLLADLQVTPEQCLYVGDDLLDLPVMRRVGIAVAVGDAVAEARAVAHWQLSTPGGRGAVREMAERLLKARGQWELVLQKYE